MAIFLRKETDVLRRWINCLGALLIPGSAHYCSGNQCKGLIWFSGYLLIKLSHVGLSLSPPSSYTPLTVHPIEWLALLFYIALLISSWKCDIANPKAKIFKFIGLWSVIIFLIPFCVNYLFLDAVFAPHQAMYPSLKQKDSIYINRMAYRFAQPKRGDIVLFNTQGMLHPQIKADHLYLKRIVGLPGETIRIVPPNILINDTPLVDPKIFKKLSKPSEELLGYQLASPFPTLEFVLNTPEDAITLREGEYLVFSDNPTSPDSRNWGPIRKHNILGKAYYICAPAEHKGYIR